MIYIEKNDKPNFLEKIFNIIKVQNNTLFLPINIEKGNTILEQNDDNKFSKNLDINRNNEKQIEKLAAKTKRIIPKLSTSKKVVLSRKMKKEDTYINYLNMYGFEIADGKWLSEILLTDIVKYIIEKEKIEKANISILINDLTEIEYQNIKILAKKYSTINIVTNHIEKFKKLEEKLQEADGIVITITNNKRKSLLKSNIVINVDFPNELFNQYRLNEDSIVVSLKMPIKIKQKRFNGKFIKDYEISYSSEICDEKYFSGKYFLKDLYESKLYKCSTFKDLKERIKMDKVKIENLNN